ncbi:lipid-binding SYLF domain-containing protein [Sneathiella limimaris]|uniref:lipid-binding SYLF domain-containing protein n=1 Tax=Sneathiella limimaris TaxID=1964213 RepID=UPI001469F833|nr:lipid-binding SYLF domain-containing protein [Sneathiella limimaris]
MKRLIAGLIVGALTLLPIMSAQAANEQQQVVDKAKLTIEAMKDMTEMSEFRKLLAVAKGVVIFPQFLKAGFIVGGAGGTGVLLGRNDQGMWSSPAFYTMGQASVGLQIGAEAKELVLLIMTDKGLDAIIKNQVKLGGDLSAAVGPVGKNVGASSTTNMDVDVFSFAKTAGLFIGASVEGSLLDAKDDWQEAYYGKPVTARNIVILRSVDTPAAQGLKDALKNAEAP